MTAFLLKGVAPYGDAPVDLLIRNGVVATGSTRGATVVDAAGLVALPGLVDLFRKKSQCLVWIKTPGASMGRSLKRLTDCSGFLEPPRDLRE